MKDASQRAVMLMNKSRNDERSATRSPLHVAAVADCPQLRCFESSALLRDVSPHGVFFFAHFVPEIGAEVCMSFCSRPSGSSPRVYCRGKVVRVEQLSSGAAGIALKLDEYRLTEEICNEMQTGMAI